MKANILLFSLCLFQYQKHTIQRLDYRVFHRFQGPQGPPPTPPFNKDWQQVHSSTRSRRRRTTTDYYGPKDDDPGVYVGAPPTGKQLTGVPSISDDIPTTTFDYSEYSDETTPPTIPSTSRSRRPRDSSSEKEPPMDPWYKNFRDTHNLPEPYQIPGRKKIVDLENMAACKCPRVYWPVCAKNNITYLNYCIMDCLDQEIRRYGPCINYRRAYFSEVF
ncbi:uncharacterized protein LOC135083508 [Ostrinia nubilalis]|uniref:uncharacterized protein LOC135083508 n=1 Tax=Ostrinia nubilalis TaxID=29057 RepID=UPI003082619A